MLRTIVAGVVLTVVTFLTVIVGEGLGLRTDSVALLGVASGAVVALVPDQTATRRLAAYLLGFLAALIGYLFRAALTPDTSGGRAISAALIVLLCVGVVAITVGRLPLWGALLGAGSLSGAYEFTYTQAAIRVLDTSVSTATALLVCVGAGFLATALVAPGDDHTAATPRATDEAPLTDMMETSK